MSIFPDTPKTLLDELERNAALDEFKWRRFDEMYRPVVAHFLVQRFGSLAHEVDDLVQDVMFRLIIVLREGKYNAGKSRFRTYLRALVVNAAIDRLRRIERFARIPFETVNWTRGLDAGAGDPDAAVRLDRQWREALYRAARDQVLARESTAEHHREIFLALERGESPAELAKRFNLSAAAVRQIGHRIRTAIQAMLRELA